MTDLKKSTEELQEVVRRLTDTHQPDRIYLFGSYARGTQTQGQSDIDLLVIVPDSDLPRHKREALYYDTLWGLTIPVELVVLTREEFNKAKGVKTSLASTALAQGILIYG
jgi:predicted nucleotidyltransferase